MIFYASGAITDDATIELVAQRDIALLTSYAYKSAFRQQMPRLAALLRAAGKRLRYMLDSGAFTAWNKGKEVNRAALIDFYNWAHDSYGDCLDLVVVSLDRIPGRQGVERTAEDYRVAAEESVRNYDYMRTHVRAYVKPVYHDGDPQWVLDAYAPSPYISLSANQDMSYSDREAWVSDMVRKLPGRQLHGLAMTGTRMLRTARWHSVDSAAWRLWSAYGALAWLRDDGSLKILACSQESPRRKHFDVHLSSLTDIERDRIMCELAAERITEEQVRTDAIARARWNILVFKRACEWAASQTVVEARRQEGLFSA